MAPKMYQTAAQQISSHSWGWLYDEIMQHIEPDLLSDRIDALEERYKGETKEQRADRLSKYMLAFKIFTESLQEVSEMQPFELQELQHSVQINAH